MQMFTADQDQSYRLRVAVKCHQQQHLAPRTKSSQPYSTALEFAPEISVRHIHVMDLAKAMTDVNVFARSFVEIEEAHLDVARRSSIKRPFGTRKTSQHKNMS